MQYRVAYWILIALPVVVLVDCNMWAKCGFSQVRVGPGQCAVHNCPNDTGARSTFKSSYETKIDCFYCGEEQAYSAMARCCTARGLDGRPTGECTRPTGGFAGCDPYNCIPGPIDD